MSRLLSLVTVSVIAVTGLPLLAQQQVASAVPTVRSRSLTAPLATVRERAATTIQGNALSSTNGPMNHIVMRLRDARFGRIVGAPVTDASGLFAFRAIDPGSYIVEMMANDRSIMAASQLLSIDAGEAITALVKVPFRIPAFAGILGQSTSAPTAAAIATEAAASSVAALVPTIPVSPGE
jgi:hypothetical protein